MTSNFEFLHPDHLADLKKSGLSDETILESGIKSVRPADINKIFGYALFAESCYEIPYSELSYSRYKMFYDETHKIDSKGEQRPKYLALKDSGNHLYIPYQVRPFLKDISRPLYITEGEKKALKACQEGLPCIAISGLWNWKVKDSDELIPDFDQISLDGRTILVVPDNDFLLPDRYGKPKNLKQAVSKLAYKLIDMGAKVSWVELPQDEKKVGLDDYLCSLSVDDFKKLPVHTIRKLTIGEAIGTISKDSPIDEVVEILKRIALLTHKSEASRYINELAKRTGISKIDLRGDVKSFVKKSMPEGESQNTVSAYFPGLVDVVINKSGDVVYLISNENSLEVASVLDINGTLFTPPAKEHLPFLLPRADEVSRWYTSDNDQKIFEDVLAYLRRFSYLPDGQWLIVACNTFLSYIQDNPGVHYLPMLLFFAVPERGKSRTGKAITYISWRGIHVVDLREANLFRFAQNLKATLFFDLMDLWKKAEKNGAEDILLSRYEKGARATRVIYPEKGAFEDTVYYDIYGPTLMASNEAVHKILGTRCIDITMPNKPGNYENPTPEMAQELKERLTAWRARMMNKSLPEIDVIEGINGRFWDITKPLLQICTLVYPQRFGDLKNALLEVAGTRIEDKKESIEGQIVATLYELSPKDASTWIIKTGDLLEELNKNRNDDKKLSPQYIGKKLKALGMTTRQIHGYSQCVLNVSDFNMLLMQYGFQNITPNICENSLPKSTLSTYPPKLRDSAGRQLVDSAGNSTESLPAESLENKGQVDKVDLGRLSGESFDTELLKREVTI